MSIGEKFRKYLNDKGIEQKDAAKEMEISPQQLSMMINGKRPFHQESIEKIAQIWPDININWLFKELMDENIQPKTIREIETAEKTTGLINEIEEKLLKIKELVAQK